MSPADKAINEQLLKILKKVNKKILNFITSFISQIPMSLHLNSIKSQKYFNRLLILLKTPIL